MNHTFAMISLNHCIYYTYLQKFKEKSKVGQNRLFIIIAYTQLKPKLDFLFKSIQVRGSFKQKVSVQCLELLNCFKSEISVRYVTMDERWMHCFTPHSDRIKFDRSTISLRSLLDGLTREQDAMNRIKTQKDANSQ